MKINTKLPLGVVFGDFSPLNRTSSMLILRCFYLVSKVETMIVAPLEMVSPMFVSLPAGWSQVLILGTSNIFTQFACS